MIPSTISNTPKYEKKNTSLTISLLREELKSRKLAILLHQLGVEEQCPWLPSFNDAIADCLNIQGDEEFVRYDKMMDVYAKYISSVEDIAYTAKLIVERRGMV